MSILITYNEIKDILSDLANEDGSKVFNRVAIWNSQILNESIEQAFNFPAAFIHFSEINWTTLQNAGGYHTPLQEQQRANETTITIHICHKHLENAEDSFSIIQPINEKVYFALQGKQTDTYGPLVRKAERQDDNHNAVIDWQMDFGAPLVQLGQSVDKTTVDADSLTLNIDDGE